MASKRRLLNPGRVPMQALRQVVGELTQIMNDSGKEGISVLCPTSLMKTVVDRIAEALASVAEWEGDMVRLVMAA